MQSLINHLEHISSYDQLTNIFNRRKFFEVAEKLFQSSQPILVAMADIDKFKSVNDTYGHPVGDIVLKNVVSIIKQNLPKTACFGRLGGEEFAIILPNTDLEGAFHVAENMRDSLESTPLDYEGETIKLTASAGVSTTIILDEEHDNSFKQQEGFRQTYRPFGQVLLFALL